MILTVIDHRQVETASVLHRAVKVTADYEETYFRGGGASGDRETERDVFTRIQVGF